MKIETKLNIGNTIWFMYNNKPIMCKIRYINIVARIEKQTISNYNIDILYTPDCNLPDISEERTFKTKQELIDSL